MTIAVSNGLLGLAEQIDIPEDEVARAIAAYVEVGDWLAAEGSALVPWSPQIYPQGSFRLGTPVRPMGGGGEFDIDLVCRLNLGKEQTTQRELRDRVGARLRENDEFKRILRPRRRCWTLTYAGRFHLDVLPSIPDREKGGSGILLTDRELTRWQHSNPVGYADWFFGRGEKLLALERQRLAGVRGVDVEDVEYSSLRTPLQRTVQLLKRHRDLVFRSSPERKPASIVVTTLAAHAYGGETDLDDALSNVARSMGSKVERREGRWWIANPAHAEENFADKWNEDDELKRAFDVWLEVLERDLRQFADERTEVGLQKRMRNTFFPGDVAEPTQRTASVPDIGAAGHAKAVPWKVTQTARVDVRGWLYSKEHGGRRLWELREHKLVPKKLGLKFMATTNAQAPYSVMWQVVNTGVEAARDNGLRGEFYISEKGEEGVRWERTAYAGQHWVEAFVTKNGVCVARSGKFMVRIAS